MKTTINGVEIEGTPEEIIQLLQMPHYIKKTDTQEQKTKYTPTPKKTGIRKTGWTEGEDQVIRNNAQNNDGYVNLKELIKQLPHRTPGALEKRCYDIGMHITGAHTVRPRKQNKKYRQPMTRKHHARWSQQEDQTLKNCVHPEIGQAILKEVNKALPHRTNNSINWRCHVLRISLVRSKTAQKRALKIIKSRQKQSNTPITNTYTPKKTDLRSIRGKFICQKADKYQKEYNWSREKAWSKAVMDWQAFKSSKMPRTTITASGNIPFPTITGVHNDSIPQLKQILKDLSSGKIQVFNYETATHTIMPREGMWNHNKWYFLVNELLSKSGIICDSLGVLNKFKIVRTDDVINLIYE